MAATTAGQQKVSLFIKGRGLLLFLVFLIAFLLFIPANAHYDSGTHFSATNGNPLTITGAPGELVSISVNAGSSVSGYWATDGMTLSLNGPANFSATIVAPRDRDWSSEISTSADNPDSDMMLNGFFTIPSNLGASGQTFTGQISGNVQYPADEGFAFTESQKAVSIPVRLLLVDPTVFFLSTPFPLYAVTGLGAFVLLILPAFFRLTDVRRKSAFPRL